MKIIYARVYALGLTSLLLLLLLSGCGGGGDGKDKPSSPNKITLKGFVQKGLFTQLTVAAYPVDETTGALGNPVETTSTNSNYELTLSAQGYYQLQATGTFINEVSGESTQLDDPLLSVIEVSGSTQGSNINLYTTMAAEQVESRVDAGATLAQAVTDANDFVRQTVGVDSTVDLTALDITAISTDTTADNPNLQLLLFSASVLQNASNSQTTEPQVLGEVISRFGAYTTLGEAAVGLSVLGGVDAASLYNAIQPNLSDAPVTLPALDTGSAVFVCNTRCDWQLDLKPMLSISGMQILESVGKVKLTLSLTRAIETDVQVQLSSADLTAIKGIDYRPVNQRVIIPANALSVDVLVDLIIDGNDENTESVRYEITGVGNKYLLAQAFRDVRIFDGYGLAETVTNDPVAISSVCLSAIGDGLNIQSNGCLADAPTSLPTNDTAAIAVDLSVQYPCTALNNNCNKPELRDWLVELTLESVSLVHDSVQASQSLGFYLFPGEKVHPSFSSAVIETLYIHLNPTALEFLNTAKNEKFALRIRARLTETAQRLSSTTIIEQPLLLPEKIIAGDRELNYILNSAYQIEGCEGSRYIVDASFSLDGVVYLSKKLCINTLEDSEGNIQGYLDAGQQLDLGGSKIPLPAFHSSHIVYDDQAGAGNRLQTLGANYLIVPTSSNNAATIKRLCDEVDCYQGQGGAQDSPIYGLSVYLHAEGLPFAFKISSGYLDDTGIHLNYSARKYLQAGEFSTSDLRSVDLATLDNVTKVLALWAHNTLESNDIFYKQSGSGLLALKTGGINTSISGAAGSGVYAFPQGEVQWQSFSFNIDNSKINGLTTLPVTFSLQQTSRCKGCDASAFISYQLQGNLLVDDNGTALGQLTSLVNTVPTWGQVSGQKAFQRSGDLPVNASAMVSLPGYIFELPEGAGIDTLLLSHVQNNTNSLLRHSLTSATAIEGNEWPVGITLGPQTYFGTSGEPVVGSGRLLNGTSLAINNGIDTFTKPVNIGAKYVVRNSGIKGVFNLDINPLIGDDMVMFGYDIKFSRFGFRLTDNTLDEYSWIDGLIRVPGDGNFDTEFTSLSLACDAKFGRGMVTYCDSDECQQNLKTWNADTDIINMAFVGAGGIEAQACIAENQQLSLEQTAEMLALTDGKGKLKPAGLVDVLWSPAGELVSNRLAPLQDMVLDAKEFKRGFSIAPGQGRLNVLSIDSQNYGVLELNNTTLVASPFWDSMQTDIRLANTSTSAEQSVVVAAGQLQVINKQKNNLLAANIISEGGYKQYSPNANFTWGNSSFGFSLPVYYATGSLTEQASFFGRRKEADLLVMKADAGIDYIQPSRTHLSLGASADIPQLGSLPIRIDISDLASLKNVDGLLADLNIGLSLEATFKDNFPLQPYIDRILKMGDNGLSMAIEETLNEILTRSAEIDGVNVWQELAEPVVALQSIPLQLDVVFDSSISQSFESGVYQKSINLRAELETLSLSLEAAKDVSIHNVSAKVAITANLQRVRAALKDIKDANTQVEADINRARDQALTLVNSVDGRISNEIQRLKNAIEKISGAGNGILQQAVKINDLAACRAGDLTVDKADFLKPNIKLINDVAKVIDLLANTGDTVSGVANFVSLLYTGESELMAQFRQRVESIQLDIRLVKSDFSDGANGLYSAICDNPSDDYLQQALQAFQQLNNQADAIIAALENVQAELVQQATDAIMWTQIISAYSDRLGAILGGFEQQLINPADEYTIGVLRDQINLAIVDIAESFPLSFQNIIASENIKIDQLFAVQNSGQVDFHSGVVEPIYIKLEAIPNTIRDSMPTLTFPGAYFSADEYKAMVINRIMDSPGIARLRNDVNRYLQSYIDKVMSVQLIIGDQINIAIKAQLVKIASPLNDVIAKAAAELPLPIKAAEMDGFAVIQNTQLVQLHIAAGFEMPGQGEGAKGNKFKGAFDAYRQLSSDDTQNCDIGGINAFTTAISAMGPISIGDSDPVTASIMLKFTLNTDATGVAAYLPVGLNGGISVQGEMDYDPFILRDVGFVAGLGLEEVYLGAGAVGSFDTTQLGLFAFLGRTCDASVISDIDSKVADFITIKSPFTGIYGRGEATIPVYSNGCLLSVDASATIGSWITIEPVPEVGGLIGGGVMGTLACLGSVRGELITAASINSRGDVFFAGKAFAVAGIGPDCDVGSWSSRSRSRNDDWCGTADVGIGVKYENESWEYDPKAPSALH